MFSVRFFQPLCTHLAQKELSHTIHLHPSYFGPCEFGYIIAVISILDIGKGLVTPGNSQAEFVIRYNALVCNLPFKGEVMDGVVVNVNKMGFFMDLIYPELKFDPNSNPPSFASEDQIGTALCRTFMSSNVCPTKIFAIGTIKENHLGAID
ncbi:hypothetical protein L226DRAFT_545045 [Lentinus tigrinus ALCF2SS1-7]|uniref:S1 motif domain-containing protein n=1 Tax=Lentinus tigrinus ALCF2SS1-6 TaxID=1328759 RepID=A0A5C2SML5_9APHY|nr:hypothetical protein L227DRAFT_584202 [Lentinus tigrinus ALCF2SS1-6]RPD76729.1 hypothetical protein L226DRAFT_545045 [Lentinus tigrinus ALCF2SS1-7]